MAFHDLEQTDRLLIARRGTSYFAQRLAELGDDDLDGDTLLAGWTRKHLVAHVAFNATALCRLLDWAATGVETPMYASVDQRNAEIAEGAMHSASELRNLFDQTVHRLDERWRQLPRSAWGAEVRTAQGRNVPATETIWMRTREMWIHAVDLDSGAQFGDFPEEVLESLLTDIVATWRRNGVGSDLVLQVTGAGPVVVSADPANPADPADTPDTAEMITVRGTLAQVVRWAAGRGAIGLNADRVVGDPPRWL